MVRREKDKEQGGGNLILCMKVVKINCSNPIDIFPPNTSPTKIENSIYIL